MKKFYILMLVLIAFITSGCTQTMYNKSITITKDADGKIIQTVETESVSQPGRGWTMKMEKIKDVQP